MNTNIENKVIVITGASSGLGEATARFLAQKGAKVVLGARRSEKLAAIVNDIRAQGGEAEYVTMDVTKSDQVKMLVDKAIETFGRLDVMINNAGLMSIASMAEVKVDEWDRMVDINIKGVLYGIAAALPVFTKQNNGHFINLASVAAHKVSPGSAVYSGTKFAVKAITEGLRAEVGGNIRTTLLSPGLIDSELKFGSSDEATSQFVQDIYKVAIPALSIAKAVAYAIEQPDDVDINEIIIRPTIQDF